MARDEGTSNLFQQSKNSSSKLLLIHNNPKLEIIVIADAFNHKIVVVISLRFPGGKEKPVFQTLNPDERKYS